MRAPKAGHGFIAGIAATGVALSLLAWDGDEGTGTSRAPAPDCYSLTWDDAYAGMPELWQEYADRGWTPSQTDGLPALYSPDCFALPA